MIARVPGANSSHSPPTTGDTRLAWSVDVALLASYVPALALLFGVLSALGVMVAATGVLGR